MDEQYTYDEDTLKKKLWKIGIDDGIGGVIIIFIIYINLYRK